MSPWINVFTVAVWPSRQQICLQWRIQDFPDGDRSTPKVDAPTCYFGPFPQKLIQNEKKMDREGYARPLDNNLLKQKFHYILWDIVQHYLTLLALPNSKKQILPRQ